jgi:hypothetical protein
MKIAIFWDIAPCSSYMNRRFRECIASIFRAENQLSKELIWQQSTIPHFLQFQCPIRSDAASRIYRRTSFCLLQERIHQPDMGWTQCPESCWSHICIWSGTCPLMFGTWLSNSRVRRLHASLIKEKPGIAGSFSSCMRPNTCLFRPTARRLLRPPLAHFCLSHTPVFSNWPLHTPTQLLAHIKPGERE